MKIISEIKSVEKSAVDCFFKNILASGKTKVVGVYAPKSFMINHGKVCHMADEEIYIILDNGKCLKIEYHFIDEFSCIYYEMTKKEMEELHASMEHDAFNFNLNVVDNNKNQIKKFSAKMLYSAINEVRIKSITTDYTKWVNRQIDCVSPKDQTFGEIEFLMDNGNSFAICADDAESDGYALLYTKTAEIEEYIKK